MEDKETRALSEEEADQVAGGGSVKQKQWIKYHVVDGDSLRSIARRYNCTDREIKMWNALKSDAIMPDMTLDIYTENY